MRHQFRGHFGSGKKLGEEAVKAHLQFYLKGGADMLKVQTEQTMVCNSIISAYRAGRTAMLERLWMPLIGGRAARMRPSRPTSRACGWVALRWWPCQLVR